MLNNLKNNESQNIEKLVDEIISKNKDKIEKINLKKTSDIYCLKNKNSIYYLKKKSDKPYEEIRSRILSEKIITKTLKTLDEKPLERKNNNIKNQNNLHEKPSKNKIKFKIALIDEIKRYIELNKKEHKKISLNKNNYVKKRNVNDNKILEKPINTIQKENINKLEKFNIDNTKKFFKDKKEPKIKSDKSLNKSKNFKNIFTVSKEKKSFFKKRDVKTNDIINKSFAEEKVDKNPYFEVENLRQRNEQVTDDTLLLNNKICEKPINTIQKENINKLEKFNIDNTKKFFKDKKEPKIKSDKSLNKSKNFKNIFTVSKEKKSFFKKRDVKTNDIINKSFAEEKVDKNPYFKVENLPQRNEQGTDDTLLLNNKIQEFLEKNINVKTTNKTEKKSLKLFKKHIEDKEIRNLKKETQINQTAKLDIQTPVELNIIKEESNGEHVFFNEENSSFIGWSPQKIDNEKKDIFQTLTHKGEISSENSQNLGSIELPKNVLQSKTVKLSDLGFTENEWEELDFYPIDEPFAYVEILREKESHDKGYFLVELALTEEEENLLAFISDTMSKITIDTYELEEKGEDDYLIEKLNQVINEYNIKINDEQRKKIYYYISKTTLGLGRIEPLMKDSNIEDLSCDGANVPIFLYHRKYGSLKCNIKFNNEDELSSFVHKLAQKCGKHISISEPMLDATMPDGSRIQMTLSDEITAKGSTFTIRKFREDPFSPPDLFELNTLSSEMIAYMWIAVENGINTLFAGGTASGKTTTLNALSLFIPREAKIVSIEETREISLPHPNWIPGVSRSGFGDVVADRMVGEIDMYDLMKAALRQRPEYILVGEIRGKEAYVLFQAMATGHATYSTVHANSAQSLIHRLEGKPINIPRIMLQSLDIVCFHVITRVKNMRARRCSQIIEIVDIDPATKEILTNEVFHWDPVEDKFIFSGKSYILERIRAEKDMSRDQMAEEIKSRMQIVEWMNKSNVRAFKEVANLVSQYSEAPQDTLKMIGRDVKSNE